MANFPHNPSRSDLIRESGWVRLRMGAESASDRLLTILRKKISGAPLVDLAILHGGTYMDDIETALNALDNVVDAQMRDRITPNLQEQKEVIAEILREIADEKITSERMNALLIKLRSSFKE